MIAAPLDRTALKYVNTQAGVSGIGCPGPTRRCTGRAEQRHVALLAVYRRACELGRWASAHRQARGARKGQILVAAWQCRAL